ncbi:hypothetical protein PsorP6_004362 [Peronosclerospora sorghi]|uniref:Uncharacterized protein n=1 Tax=Peronosclerospora sorghi TaxID=230839 RepID=A0ACC0VPQ8_9STRA|nr:hypothetical protein PsorP6_004362 [Peronosclerospora sorghi]
MPGEESNSRSNSSNWRRKTPAGGRKDSDAEHKKKKVRRGGRRNKNKTKANANINQSEVTESAVPAVGEHSLADVQTTTATSTSASLPTNLDYLSNVLFASLDISAETKRAITEHLKFERLTNVQNETFSIILQGKDVLAKAKTGNGKTIAFLLPVIENMVKKGRQSDVIPTIVVSPTRELAQQIAVEAKRLTKFHDFKVVCFVGGSNVKNDIQMLEKNTLIDILVATPGRLVDLLDRDDGMIKGRVGKASVLILDEADRLLDMGFRPDVMRIIDYLPKERQTLLFSATLPASTKELKQIALRKDYSFVDTIDEDEADTNIQTEQEYIICKMEDVIPMVECVVIAHMKLSSYKVMLFFPTARSAQFMAQLFQAAGFPGVLEIHSRMSQPMRTKTAAAFRQGRKVLLFSSDVSARGVDYPNVSLVVQVGLTTRDQYIHRLGRTARAGTNGRGVLILSEFESSMLDQLTDLPLTVSTSHSPKQLVHSQSRALKITKNLKDYTEVEKSAQQSYQAWLGFYKSHMKHLKMTSVNLVRLAADYCRIIGLDKVPKLEERTLKKMNLLGVPGIEPSPHTYKNGANGVGNGRR